MGKGVTPVARGCGTRVQGGIYLECGLGKNGRPVEDFLYDPPIILPTREMGISAMGTHIRPEYRNVNGVPTATGVYHIYDIVGQEFYPNVADFVEEIRRFGLSRRISERADFHLLDSRSRLITLHARAYIMNADDLWPRRDAGDWCSCPKRFHHHEDATMPPPMCAALWWQTLERANRRGPEFPATQRERVMPSFRYTGLALHDDYGDGPLPLHYHMAAFAAWPITNIAVIKAKGGEHLRSHEKASKAKLHVSLEDA